MAENATDRQAACIKLGGWVNRRAGIHISPSNPRRQRIRAGIVPALCLITVLQFPLEVSPAPRRRPPARAILSRLRPEPTRSSGRVVYPRPPSRLHHRVDGHCTLNKAAGVNCTGFNERRSTHPLLSVPWNGSHSPLVFNRRRFLNY